MSYVYIKSERAGHQGAEHDLFTVGHYEPSGKFHPESDHADEGDAAKCVRWLNGGRETPQSESAPITPEQKAAWRALDKGSKDTVSGAFLAFAAMMDKDYGISKAQAVKMMDIAYDVNGATK